MSNMEWHNGDTTVNTTENRWRQVVQLARNKGKDTLGSVVSNYQWTKAGKVWLNHIPGKGVKVKAN